MRVRVTQGGEAQLIEKPRALIHRRRSKAPTVDVDENPFALERQLEDQRFQILRNKNPRLEQSLANTLALESKRFKGDREALQRTRIVSKIVRDASGLKDYVLTPPRNAVPSNLPLDVDTAPFLRPYRKENNVKPAMSSFGHRPSSASRTFHPATMKISMRHGEVASTGSRSFGLPNSTLNTLMHSSSLSTATSALPSLSASSAKDASIAHLEQQGLDYTLKARGSSTASTGGEWDGGHHVMVRRRRDRSSTYIPLPISERLTRFRNTTSQSATIDTASINTGPATLQMNGSSRLGRRMKYEEALSKIPQVAYQPSEFVRSMGPRQVSSEERDILDMSAAFKTTTSSRSRASDKGRVSGMSRAYGSLPAMLPPLGRTDDRSEPAAVAATSSTGRADRGVNVTTAPVVLASDRLFDFVMQEEGSADRLATDDEDVLLYIEDRLMRERAQAQAKALSRTQYPSPTKKSARRLSVPGASSSGDPMMTTGLYVHNFFDFNKQQVVEPLREEVRALEASLAMLEPPSTELESLGGNSANDTEAIALVASHLRDDSLLVNITADFTTEAPQVDGDASLADEDLEQHESADSLSDKAGTLAAGSRDQFARMDSTREEEEQGDGTDEAEVEGGDTASLNASSSEEEEEVMLVPTEPASAEQDTDDDDDDDEEEDS